MSKLFKSYKLGRLELSNRIIMAPMTRSRAIDNVANALIATYYAQRASAGLIITEGISPSPNGLGYARIPGLFNLAQAQSWKLVTEAVHRNGGKIFAQLMHTGRVGHPLNLPAGARLLAPSAIPLAGSMWTDQEGLKPHPTPEAMNEQDLFDMVQEFVHSARLAMQAGFDGVEIHGANGYLLHQFMNSASNHRTDDFGGTLRKRLRIPLVTAGEVAKAIGADRVGFRISPFNPFNGMNVDEDAELSRYLIYELEKIGVAYVHAIDPGHAHSDEFASLKGDLRRDYNGTLIFNGGYDGERAEADVDAGRADLIAFGRPFISNPDLVAKLQHGLPLVSADPATFYTPDAKGYTDYDKETSYELQNASGS